MTACACTLLGVCVICVNVTFNVNLHLMSCRASSSASRASFTLRKKENVNEFGIWMDDVALVRSNFLLTPRNLLRHAEKINKEL